MNESCGLSSAVLAAAVASASGAVTAASMLLIFFNDAAYDDDDVVRLLLTIIDEDGDWMGMEVGGGRCVVWPSAHSQFPHARRTGAIWYLMTDDDTIDSLECLCDRKIHLLPRYCCTPT